MAARPESVVVAVTVDNYIFIHQLLSTIIVQLAYLL